MDIVTVENKNVPELKLSRNAQIRNRIELPAPNQTEPKAEWTINVITALEQLRIRHFSDSNGNISANKIKNTTNELNEANCELYKSC